MCLFFRRFSDSRTNEFEKSIISTQAYHHLDAGCLKLERPIFRRENGWQLIIQKLEQWTILIFMHWISTIIAGEKQLVYIVSIHTLFMPMQFYDGLNSCREQPFNLFCIVFYNMFSHAIVSIEFVKCETQNRITRIVIANTHTQGERERDGTEIGYRIW